MKHRKRLSRKFFRTYIIFAAIIIICTCLSVSTMYWNEEMETYRQTAYSYTRMVSDYVDGDKIAEYLETGETDVYYHTILALLNSAVSESSDLVYLYVFVPYESDLVYIWDADVDAGSCELGEREAYMEGGRDIVDSVYKSNPEEEIHIVTDEKYGFIASAYSPVFDSSKNPVALVGVDLSMPRIRGTILKFICTIIISIALVTAAVSVVFLIFIRKSVLKPISDLNSLTKKTVENLENDRSEKIKLHTNDELEELADSIGQMEDEVRDYITRLSSVTAEKERIGAELNVAAHIQSDMLPSIFPPFPERDEFDIYASMTPAKEVGGDFYDFFLTDHDHLALVMADVSGKGVPAALFMMISKMLIKNAVQMGLSPKAALEKVNNQLCENNEAEMFVTVWLGLLDISTGRMICSNAGHEYPAIYRAGGRFTLLKDRHGFVVGGMENMKYSEYEIRLNPGDKLFVYTDGVAEASDSDNRLYGTERMTQALNRHAQDSCSEILHGVYDDLLKFAGGAPQFDDITMLALEIHKAGDAIKNNHKENTGGTDCEC